MKAVVLFASPHTNGYTNQLLLSFLSGLSGDWTVYTYAAFQQNPMACTACGYCAQADGCRFSDLDEFFGALEAADLLILATPVYNLSFPAPMKAVIDRFQRYFEARFSRQIRKPIAKHRQAVLLLTMGRESEFAQEVCERTLRQSFSVMNTTLAGSLCLTHTDDFSPEAAADVFRKAARMAIEIEAGL